MDLAAVLMSGIALLVSRVAVVYSARSAITNERRLRGECDAPRTTYFELHISRRRAYYLDERDEEPFPHTITACNMGKTDARRVKLRVKSEYDGELWK